MIALLKIERNATNAELLRQNQEVPIHLDLPRLCDILKMRQKPVGDKFDQEEIQQAFTFLVEHLLGHVIGKSDWDTTKCFHPVSDKVTISDEAYTLLLCENVYEKWMQMKPPQAGQKLTVVKGKYTDPENGATNEKFKGWTADGIQRYNQLYQDVQRNRNQQWAEEVETTALQDFQGRYKGKLVGAQIRRKKRKLKGWDLEDDSKEYVEYPMAMNELDKKMESAPASNDTSDSE